MKKNIVKIIIAVVVLAVLVGATVLLNKKPTDDATPPSDLGNNMTSYTVYSEKEENVKNISIASADFSIEAKNNSGTWTINDLSESDTDESKVKSLIGTALNINASSLVAENLDNAEDYGLKEPQVTITVNKNDGSADKVYIGSESPVKDGYFVTTSLDNKVYILDSYKLSALKNPVSYYTDFVKFSMEDTSAVTSIRIERPDMTITLDRKDYNDKLLYSTWVMTSPMETEASSDYISRTILENISKITLSSPLEDGDYGFNAPSAKVTLTVNGDKGEYEEQFILGKKAEGKVYLSYKGKPYSLSAYQLDFVTAPLLNYVEKLQTLVIIDDVSEVEMNYNNNSHKLEVTHTGNEDPAQTFKLDGKDIEEGSAKRLYQELIGVLIDGFYDNQELGETVMTVKYKGRNGNADTIVEFKTISDLDCAVVKNGKAQFTVRKSIIEELKNTVDTYMN